MGDGSARRIGAGDGGVERDEGRKSLRSFRRSREGGGPVRDSSVDAADGRYALLLPLIVAAA
jgi:hypothetical protein